MVGEPNSFIKGTKDKFGATFGVSLAKHERFCVKRAVEVSKSELGREKASLKTRLQYQKVTTPYPIEPDHPPAIDLTPIVSVRNKLIGLQAEFRLKRMSPGRTLCDSLKTIDAFLRKHHPDFSSGRLEGG